METNTITSFISQVGFPIAAYAALFYYMMQQNKTQKETIDRLSDVVQANTNAIENLGIRMEERSHVQQTGALPQNQP